MSDFTVAWLGWQYDSVWYPFKFWRNVSYCCLDGVLAEELGADSPTWRHRRRGRAARRMDPSFLVGIIDGASAPLVEGWRDSPDHRFRSVVLRIEVGDSGFVWTNTRERERGSMFGIEPGDVPASIECRSGPMVAEAISIGGRTVDVLHSPGVVITEDQLRLVALDSVADGPV